MTMGYMTDGLTFNTLRNANERRASEAFAGLDHDWTLGDWVCALVGEVGEMANIIKKVRRGDLSLDAARLHLADEMADIQTYLDLLAQRCSINLGLATIHKWNEVSKRVNSKIRINDDGSDWSYA